MGSAKTGAVLLESCGQVMYSFPSEFRTTDLHGRVDRLRGRFQISRSWIIGFSPSGVTSRLASVICSLKRRRPALPGFTYSKPERRPKPVCFASAHMFRSALPRGERPAAKRFPRRERRFDPRSSQLAPTVPDNVSTSHFLDPLRQSIQHHKRLGIDRLRMLPRQPPDRLGGPAEAAR